MNKEIAFIIGCVLTVWLLISCTGNSQTGLGKYPYVKINGQSSLDSLAQSVKEIDSVGTLVIMLESYNESTQVNLSNILLQLDKWNTKSLIVTVQGEFDAALVSKCSTITWLQLHAVRLTSNKLNLEGLKKLESLEIMTDDSAGVDVILPKSLKNINYTSAARIAPSSIFSSQSVEEIRLGGGIETLDTLIPYGGHLKIIDITYAKIGALCRNSDPTALRTINTVKQICGSEVVFEIHEMPK